MLDEEGKGRFDPKSVCVVRSSSCFPDPDRFVSDNPFFVVPEKKVREMGERRYHEETGERKCESVKREGVEWGRRRNAGERDEGGKGEFEGFTEMVLMEEVFGKRWSIRKSTE